MIKKLAYLFFCFLLVSTLVAQEQETRIVLVPFSRFDFQSSFSLTEIAEFNQWKSEEVVFEHYLNFLVRKLSEGSDRLIVFSLSDQDISRLHARIPRIYKEDPATHFGVDISYLKEEGRLRALLENMAADYILFLTRYDISTRLIGTKSSFEGSKFLLWSNHELSYELYNADGELIVMGDALLLPPQNPNKENYYSRGTLLNELEKGYEKVLEDIEAKLNIYNSQRRKRPVFKLK